MLKKFIINRYWREINVTNRIDNYMTLKEAAWRWNIDPRTLREKLNIKRRPALQKDLDEGLVKYFKLPEAKYGDWIISRDAMESWYGLEPEKNI